VSTGPHERVTQTDPGPLPRLLLLATVLVGGQGCFFVGYAVLEIFHLSSSRVAMGITTSIFFAAYGGLLLACAYAFMRRDGWARSPAVLAQFITLLVAWSFRGGETTLIAVAAAGVAVVSLIGLFAPSTATALADRPSRPV
jgi:hypothetical protein